MVNINKVSRAFLTSILVSSILLPSMVKAGVVTGELVEVDEELRQELDTNRIKLSECESSRYRLEAKAQELDNKIEALVTKLKELAGNNDSLQAKLDGLKAENQQLLSERINNVKEAITTTTPTAKAEGTCNAHPFKSTLGTIVGAPISTVDGTIRGALSKGVQISDKVSTKLGDSLPAQLVSKTFGFVLGAVPGAVTGMIKGLIDGIRYGICAPFTAKSISLEGKFIDTNDWDSFDLPGDL